jgi:hypothetical protein
MHFLAALVLAIHLLWIMWVICGAFFTRGRPVLTVFHVVSLAWGIIVELSPLPCPLTLTEQFFEQQAGTGSYRGAFVAHYLDRIVYPDIPESVLVIAGVAICVVNLGIYGWRYRQWRLSSAIEPARH